MFDALWQCFGHERSANYDAKSPIVIVEQRSRGSSCCGCGCGTSPSVALKISPCVGEQVVDRLATVVARDVGVKVLPDALDAICIGAVRREEVQHEKVPRVFPSIPMRDRQSRSVI